jgi:hypothetical protein
LRNRDISKLLSALAGAPASLVLASAAVGQYPLATVPILLLTRMTGIILFKDGGPICTSIVIRPSVAFVGYRDGFSVIDCLRATGAGVLHKEANPKTNHHEAQLQEPEIL